MIIQEPLNFTPPTPILTMSLRDVSRLFRCSDTTINSMVNDGVLPKPVQFKKGGKKRFNAVEITNIFNKFFNQTKGNSNGNQ